MDELRRTVSMWLVVRNSLNMIVDDLLHCESRKLDELTRVCEDGIYATTLVVRCGGAERCCRKALNNMHTIARLNTIFVSLACLLRRTGRIKPLCIQCKANKSSEGGFHNVGFLSFFCPDCSFELTKETEALTAYGRFMGLLIAALEKNGRRQPSGASMQHYTMSIRHALNLMGETMSLVSCIPTEIMKEDIAA